MATPTIFETCRPRADVLAGSVAEEDFAADLAEVVTGRGSAQYRDNMRMVTAGIEAMEPEEAAYWAGMAIHRRRPRRVLKALRILLTER